jgi:hypothetical protein
VGESHHLANTVPPETWERVVVVQWPSLLGRISAEGHRQPKNSGRLHAAWPWSIYSRPLIGRSLTRGVEAPRAAGAHATSSQAVRGGPKPAHSFPSCSARCTRSGTSGLMR